MRWLETMPDVLSFKIGTFFVFLCTSLRQECMRVCILVWLVEQ